MVVEELALSGCALMVASTGGHLTELYRLAPRLPLRERRVVWVTNDNRQSRSLLRGHEVVFVPYQGSRNPRVGAWNAVLASGILSRYRPELVVSNGAGIALSFLPLAAARGASCHYIECATRVLGPSLTGRVLQRVPGVRRYTQHPRWAGGGWHYAGSVLDGFVGARRDDGPPAPRRVVVTLGTWRQGFRDLVERLVEVVPPDAEVIWQTGFTDVSGLGIAAHAWLPEHELRAALRDADVVVTHAGIGATLDALDAGLCPIVVPRRKAAGEQIDDHQVELAEELDRRGIAIVRRSEELQASDVPAAAARKVVRTTTPAPFSLVQ